MRCSNCGMPLHPAWTECHDCGEPIVRPARSHAAPARRGWPVPPRVRLMPLPKIAPIAHVAGAALRDGASHIRTRLQHQTPRLLRGFSHAVRRHALAIALLAIGLAVAAPTAALALSHRDDGALATARAEAASSSAQLAQARAQLTFLDTVRDAGAAETARRTQAEQRLSASEARVASLTAAADDARKQAATDATTMKQLRGRIDALGQCLDGTNVAIEFGRRGNWPAADRALAAVKDACAGARASGSTGG